jgi:hypothetical protein
MTTTCLVPVTPQGRFQGLRRAQLAQNTGKVHAGLELVRNLAHNRAKNDWRISM